jgi:enoyl-CoA hydratase/carnithine racemase
MTSWLDCEDLMTDYTTFTVDKRDGIAIVTFSRPEKMNTFNGVMMLELISLFDDTDKDDSVRAVIITGSGRAFCAGADLGPGGGTFDPNQRDMSREIIVNGVRRDGGGRVSLRIFQSLKPVIAAVNGAAVGVGATMQLPMDFRLASTEARYGFVFNRRGIAPEAASSFFLPRLVGVPQALEWMYSGRVFGAEEAKAAGLVRSVHKPDELLPAAIEFAHSITDKSAPVSIAVTRQMVWRMLGASHPMDAHRADSRAINARGAASDVREGISSFMEKRDPKFTNSVANEMPDLFTDPEPEFR